MTDAVITGSVGVGAVVFTALLAYFVFAKKFKEYIEDAVGKRPEVTNVITPQPLVVATQPSFADKKETEERFKHVESKIEASRVENKVEMEKLRLEANLGRNEIKQDIHRVADKIGDNLREFSLDIANKVGELRGEIRKSNGR